MLRDGDKRRVWWMRCAGVQCSAWSTDNQFNSHCQLATGQNQKCNGNDAPLQSYSPRDKEHIKQINGQKVR